MACFFSTWLRSDCDKGGEPPARPYEWWLNYADIKKAPFYSLARLWLYAGGGLFYYRLRLWAAVSVWGNNWRRNVSQWNRQDCRTNLAGNATGKRITRVRWFCGHAESFSWDWCPASGYPSDRRGEPVARPIISTPQDCQARKKLPAEGNGIKSGSVGAIMAQFKSLVTKRVGASRRLALIESPDNIPLWQRNYHDHIIRNEADLNRIREYIAFNPQRWPEDQNNPIIFQQKNLP